MLLIHGVLRAADATLPDGVAARVVVAGPVAAVVSTAPERELVPDDAVTHLDLLVALEAERPVLPLALGTAAGGDDAVRDELLAPRAEELAQQLAAVAELVELRLDLAFDVDASVAAVVEADPSLRRPGGGRAFGDTAFGDSAFGDRLAVGEAVAGAVADHQAALAEEWTGELAEIAERSAVLHADEQLRRTAYLVRRERLAAADDAVTRLRAAAAGRAEVEYVGPLPVYSFEIGAEAPAPSSRWGW